MTAPTPRPAAVEGGVVLYRDGATSIEPERWRSYRVDDYQEVFVALPKARHDAFAAVVEAARVLVLVNDFKDGRVKSSEFWARLPAAAYDDETISPREWATNAARTALAALEKSNAS